jgi:3-oxoacyl-[acyl-carrier protein] reductase
MMPLKNRVAIITGAASGIGEATTNLFVKAGAKVIAVDLSGTEYLEKTYGSNVIFAIQKDITHSDAPEIIMAEARNRFGKLDILINNAGICANASAEKMPIDVFDRIIDVNLRAQFRLSQQAIPLLRESKAGRIINISSVMAEHTDYGLIAYCASKSGIAGLTRTLALELGRDGITANYILAGAIETGMTREGWRDPKIKEIWAKKSPLKRVGRPRDVAEAILFLASDESGFITGHGLKVDGGMLLRT